MCRASCYFHLPLFFRSFHAVQCKSSLFLQTRCQHTIGLIFHGHSLSWPTTSGSFSLASLQHFTFPPAVHVDVSTTSPAHILTFLLTCANLVIIKQYHLIFISVINSGFENQFMYLLHTQVNYPFQYYTLYSCLSFFAKLHMLVVFSTLNSSYCKFHAKISYTMFY